MQRTIRFSPVADPPEAFPVPDEDWEESGDDDDDEFDDGDFDEDPEDE
jgi:hypothetical protein